MGLDTKLDQRWWHLDATWIVSSGLLLLLICCTSPWSAEQYSVNPQACARYLIWKELITCAITSHVHTEVVSSIPEEFFYFQHCSSVLSFQALPRLPRVVQRLNNAAVAFEVPNTHTVRTSYKIIVVNPRRACAARVTVLDLCVCVCVRVSVCVCYSTSHFSCDYSCQKPY